MGTGIAPLPTTPRPHHPGYTSPPSTARVHPGARVGGSNSAVGLKSVDQLSLVGHFSDIRGITEVYNLVILGNPNDHNLILGTE